MSSRYESKMIDAELPTDTSTNYSASSKFGADGYSVGIISIENDVDDTVTCQLYGKPVDGNDWHTVGSAVVMTASTAENIPVLYPWALLRISYTASAGGTQGELNAWLDMAKGGASGSVDLATGAEVEVSQATHDDLNANANLQVGDADVNSTTNPVPVRTPGITISQTPTVTAGAYSAGDAVGGLLTFANAARFTGAGGILTDVLIVDDAGQDVEMELWLFKETFTAISDNDAWAPSEADLENLVAVVNTADDTWRAAGTPSIVHHECTIRYDLTGTSLFGQLVTRGTPTFAATDDVTVKIKLLQD